MNQLLLKASTVLFVIALLVIIEGWIPFDFLILKVQNLLNASGKTFVIGDAQVFRPSNWMLSTSRETPKGEVIVFAFLPESLIPMKIDGPSEPFKSFVVFNNADRNGQITFIETPLEENCKLRLIEERIKRGEIPSTNRDWQIASQNGSNVLLHRSATSSLPSTIYSTATRLTIILKSVDEAAINQIVLKPAREVSSVACAKP